jgi:AcrR family transcriptional regulator
MKGDRQRRDRGSARAHDKTRTRKRIVAASAALFARKGFEHTSVSQIAARAGVSRATIFWHFGNKATLFRETFGELLSPFRDALAESSAHLAPEKRLYDMFGAYDRFVEENQQAIRAFLRWMIETPALQPQLRDALFGLHETFAVDLRETLEQILPPGHDARALAAGLVALLDGHLLLSLLASDAGADARRIGLAAVLRLVPRRPEEGG